MPSRNMTGEYIANLILRIQGNSLPLVSFRYRTWQSILEHYDRTPRGFVEKRLRVVWDRRRHHLFANLSGCMLASVKVNTLLRTAGIGVPAHLLYELAHL